MEPTKEDWLVVGNALRAVMGIPPLEDCDRGPTEEELDAYERIVPGSRALLEREARLEMEHRIRMKSYVK